MLERPAESYGEQVQEQIVEVVPTKDVPAYEKYRGPIGASLDRNHVRRRNEEEHHDVVIH